ncbi:MAG: hypothetical protein HYZ20_04720 [Burkholderiales bacterium]|nr:hypothetical protein [Burkholderiales bacterium]
MKRRLQPAELGLIPDHAEVGRAVAHQPDHLVAGALGQRDADRDEIADRVGRRKA